MVTPGEVLIVSGPPGSGKTTVASALTSDGQKSVHLESDWFYRAIRSGFVGPHLPAAHSQNTAVMDAGTDAAAAYASSGYAVVWDGVVGPWFLDRIARRLSSRGIRLRYLVLRPSRERALDRVRQRDGTDEVSGAATMFDKFVDLGEFEAHVVNSDQEPRVVLDRCRALLNGDRLFVDLGDWVDDRWPVSVKAVLGWDDRYVVLRNRRGEWELPGGRLDAADAGPVDTLSREIREELGLDVVVGPMLDSWVYEVEGKRVLILTYKCEAEEPSELSHSDEHIDVKLMDLAGLADSLIPSGYLESIQQVAARPR